MILDLKQDQSYDNASARAHGLAVYEPTDDLYVSDNSSPDPALDLTDWSITVVQSQ